MYYLLVFWEFNIKQSRTIIVCKGQGQVFNLKNPWPWYHCCHITWTRWTKRQNNAKNYNWHILFLLWFACAEIFMHSQALFLITMLTRDTNIIHSCKYGQTDTYIVARNYYGQIGDCSLSSEMTPWHLSYSVLYFRYQL